MLLTVPCCSQDAEADEPCERTIVQLPRRGQSNFKESAAALGDPRHYFFAWSLRAIAESPVLFYGAYYFGSDQPSCQVRSVPGPRFKGKVAA
jgi:hypothetical protein